MNILLFAQAIASPQAVIPQLVESPWNAAVITAIFGGLTALIGALTAMFVTLYGLRRDNAKANEKMTNQVTQVHDLVNAGNSALLEKIARLSRRIAIVSGERADEVEADAAEHDVRVKADITEAATQKRDAADAKMVEK